jgi:DNA-binding CsgD family transcriptional regulator/tetratricopeptide (TPR) repeat protein
MGPNLRAALDWGLTSGEREGGRRLAAAMARFWFLRGRAREGLDTLQRALDLGGEEDSSLQAQLLTGLAVVAMPAGRIDLNRDASEHAARMAERVGDQRTLARATAAAGYAAFYNDYERCRMLGIQAQEHGSTVGDAFSIDFGMLLEAAALANADRHDEAALVADALFARAAAIHDRFCAFSRDVRIYGALLTGDVQGAVAFGHEAVDFAQPLRDYFVCGSVTGDLAWAYGIAGELDHARRLIDPLIRSIDSAGPDVDVISLRVTIGKLLLWAGDVDAALMWLQRAAEYTSPGVDNWTAMRALPDLARAFAHLGRAEEAADAAQRGIDMAGRLGTPHALAESLDSLARVVADDDLGRAESLHFEAMAVRAERGLRLHLTDSLDATARCAARREDHAQAARLLAASDGAREAIGYPRPPIDHDRHAQLDGELRAALGEAAYEELRAEAGDHTLDDAVAYATRSRGPRGRPSLGWDSLTPTEREVVALVADGLTNPQIAERLFVSPATIKTHVSHVFTKVGVQSRSELAAATERNRQASDPT